MKLTPFSLTIISLQVVIVPTWCPVITACLMGLWGWAWLSSMKTSWILHCYLTNCCQTETKIHLTNTKSTKLFTSAETFDFLHPPSLRCRCCRSAGRWCHRDNSPWIRRWAGSHWRWWWSSWWCTGCTGSHWCWCGDPRGRTPGSPSPAPLLHILWSEWGAQAASWQNICSYMQVKPRSCSVPIKTES